MSQKKKSFTSWLFPMVLALVIGACILYMIGSFVVLVIASMSGKATANSKKQIASSTAPPVFVKEAVVAGVVFYSDPNFQGTTKVFSNLKEEDRIMLEQDQYFTTRSFQLPPNVGLLIQADIQSASAELPLWIGKDTTTLGSKLFTGSVADIGADTVIVGLQTVPLSPLIEPVAWMMTMTPAPASKVISAEEQLTT